MRFQRLRYRYAVVLSGASPHPGGDSSRFSLVPMRPDQMSWRPATDIYERPDAFLVRVDLAGVDQEQLDLTLYEDAVIVAGRRWFPTVQPGGLYHQVEIRHGPFRLAIPLPGPIDVDDVVVDYDRGLLLMTFGKAR
jgi:HSP20 family protein